jgi:putative DNA primase/helicase
MSTPLNGYSPALALLQSLWTTRPARTVRMQPAGAKYITLKDDQGADIGLTDAMLIEHLTGKATYGAPLIGADGLASALVWELDAGGLATAGLVLATAGAAGLVAWALVCPGSDGHDGAHIWCLYDQAWNPERLQEQARQVLTVAGLPHKEVYPSGANIRLPFGYHVRSQQRGLLLLQDGRQFDLNTHPGLVDAINAVCGLPRNTQAPPPAPAAAAAYVSRTRTAGDVLPLDDYDQRATRAEIEQLLESHGWTEGRGHGNVSYWTRPGKAPKEGHSATLGHVADTVLSVFSESDPQLPGEAGRGKHYGPAKLYVHLVHGGDFSAAAKDLYAQGYGTRSNAKNTSTMPTPVAQLSRGLIFKCLSEDEAGDALLVEALYAGQLLYDHRASLWYTFKGHIWEPYPNTPRRLIWTRVAAMYLQLAAELQAEAEQATDETEKTSALKNVDRLIQRAKQLRSVRRVNNVLTFASELFAFDGGQWDSNPWLLGVANGVLDLRTGQLRPGRPDDYLRKASPTAWSGLDTPAPLWEHFILEVMSNELDRAAFLQRMLGYAVNGTTKEHIVGICVGERGRNGKRVLFETIQHVLGPYAGAVSTDVIIGQDHKRIAGSAQPHLMSLQGRRIAYCSETGEYDRLNAAQVKNVTGGDRIRARDLYAKDIEFDPSHTLFLQTNRKPQAPPNDDALWERVKVIEFKVRFVDDPQSPDERPRDPGLEDALRLEASGILAWLVRGHLDWLQGGLKTPKSVKLARDTYRLQESIEPFLEATSVEWEGGSAEGGALYEAYKQWCELLGNLRPKSNVWLGKQLAQRFEKARITTGANQGRTAYHGVSLRPQAEWTVQIALHDSATLQSDTNPSVPIGTPNNAIENGLTEGLRPFSNSFLHDPPHEGKDLNIPSDPSDPSVTPTITLAPGVEQPRIVPDHIAVSVSRIQELMDEQPGRTRAEAQRQAVAEARQVRVPWPFLLNEYQVGGADAIRAYCRDVRKDLDPEELLAQLEQAA